MSYWNGTQWVPEEPEPARRSGPTRRLLGASLEASLIVLLIFGLMAGTALAAKGGNGNASHDRTAATLTLVVVSDADADGIVSYGDAITFEAEPATDRSLTVGVRCYQGSTFVFDGYVPLYDTWASTVLTFISSNWSSASDASCTARLFYYDNRSRERVSTTMTFVVVP